MMKYLIKFFSCLKCLIFGSFKTKECVWVEPIEAPKKDVPCIDEYISNYKKMENAAVLTSHPRTEEPVTFQISLSQAYDQIRKEEELDTKK